MSRRFTADSTTSLLGWILAFFALLFLPYRAGADTEIEFKYRLYETKSLKLVYYDKDQYYVIPHLARCFENSLRFHKNLFDYTPSEPVTILFQDFDDHGYAGTTTIPNNWLTLGIEPFEYVYETSPTNERMNWVMNHELVHVMASDQASRRDNFFRTIFLGKVAPSDEDPVSMLYSYLTSPRMYAPRWFHEGIAVFMETWMAGGIGRAQGGYDEMVFRAMVRDGSFFYDVVGLESEGKTTDFQIGQNSYLYGTRFVSYLAYHYGPEKVVEWAKRGKESKGYFSSQFKKVFGVSLDDEWSKWIEWEHEWQETNLDSIRQYPTTPFRVLSRKALGSVSRAYYDGKNHKIYAGVNYPGEFAHLASIDIDTGDVKKICEVPTPALYYVCGLAYDDSTSTLFFTTDNSRGWRDLNAVDLRTGKTKLLLKDNRTGDLVFNRVDSSIWGMQHHSGKSRLVRFPPPYDDWQGILLMPYGKDLFDIDISPDGKYITGSLFEISGRVYLIRMDLEKLLMGDSSYDVLWEFEKNAPANFIFSTNGKYLYGTSYYTGTSNVFRFDFEEQEMEGVSNCESGFFRPIPISDDSLIVFRYTGDGFVPVMIPNETIEDISAVRLLGAAIVEKHPIISEWVLGSPKSIKIDSLVVTSGNYNGFRSMGITSAYPIAEGYKNYAAFGLRFNLMDPVGLHGLDFALSVSPTNRLPDDEKAHFRFSYRHWPWTLSGAYNRADFYDFFGPTKTSRKGYSLELQYENYLLYERQKSLEYSFHLAGYTGLERLPDFQNIATSFDEFFSGSAELRYESKRKTIGSVEHEKGIIWKVASLNTYVQSDFYPRIYANLDYGFLLPLDHSSIWLRTSAGYSFGERDEPFANFYFGGFGNNWVDHAEVNRYREYYSFPGVELNAVGGKNYGKATLEWTLPPVRFRRFGFPALYFNWARLAFFTSVISTNIDSRRVRRDLVNSGAQMNLKLVIFSSLESTFSLGYAIAGEEGREPEREFMISLKILR
ncbi:MAG: hypothetical protein GTO42_08965 [Candidatus Latescibacteria bacterium]|nr:hypothetical protein [Candidatus Latescibacterota bacterium]NIO29092.1 hypothetical protein [Candidatus Latescibacterota bacterium]NIO56717.1 hypothetical protein [Candidatus Latescibacterota bacterium]NIT02300.1 hypothetical protein [Candidatus Latescibacterota bacterium]NIT39185.1 hypothetical protein [Candidatus Latescibacterota bacterium]